MKEYARLDILKGAFNATIDCWKFSKTINYFAKFRCAESFERMWLIEKEPLYKSKISHN